MVISRFRVFAVPILLFCSAAIAAGAELAIEGPNEVAAGSRPVRLNVQGATVPELIAGGAKVVLYPRESAEVWDSATWGGEPYLLFVAEKPGKYLVAIAMARGGKLLYAEHQVLVKGGPNPNPPPSPPPPGPTPNPYQAVEAWKSAVQPLSSFKLKSPDAVKLAAAWAEAGKFARAAPVGSTTADLRRKLIGVGKPLDLKGRYAGLGSAVDAILAGALGLDVRPLDGPRAADLLETMAWAAWETGR